MSYSYLTAIPFNVKKITRKEIPDNIYLCKSINGKDWNSILLYKFKNGFNYILGTNSEYLSNIEEILLEIKSDYETIIPMLSPEELQEYYYEEFDIFQRYKYSKKIFNYYHNNREKIEDILISYNLF